MSTGIIGVPGLKRGGSSILLASSRERYDWGNVFVDSEKQRGDLGFRALYSQPRLQLLRESVKKGDRYFPRHISWLQGRREISSRVYVCGQGYEGESHPCYEPECESHWAWIEKGVCLAYLAGSAAGFTTIDLLPFSTG